MSGDGIAVVLDEEAQRQLPGGREVHGLEDGADIHRAVAEIGENGVAGPGPLVREGRAGRDLTQMTADGRRY